MWRHVDAQADWRRRLTYGRTPNAIERFFSGTLEANSSDGTGLTLHAQTYIQKNATLV